MKKPIDDVLSIGVEPARMGAMTFSPPPLYSPRSASTDAGSLVSDKASVLSFKVALLT